MIRGARRARVRPEHFEQVELASWARANAVRYPELGLLFAIPNGARTSIRTAVKLKQEGLRSGVPDLMLPVARGEWHGLFIELKRVRGGRASPAQLEWALGLTERGYCVTVSHGAEEAKRFILRYLALPKDGAELTDQDGEDDTRHARPEQDVA